MYVSYQWSIYFANPTIWIEDVRANYFYIVNHFAFFC